MNLKLGTTMNLAEPHMYGITPVSKNRVVLTYKNTITNEMVHIPIDTNQIITIFEEMLDYKTRLKETNYANNVEKHFKYLDGSMTEELNRLFNLYDDRDAHNDGYSGEEDM